LYLLGGILGLFWKAPGAPTWPAEVISLADRREVARKARDWKQADSLRDELLALGVVVEDGPQGPRLKKRG
jgi:cysteinyl-tRNA synthetase